MNKIEYRFWALIKNIFDVIFLVFHWTSQRFQDISGLCSSRFKYLSFRNISGMPGYIIVSEYILTIVIKNFSLPSFFTSKRPSKNTACHILSFFSTQKDMFYTGASKVYCLNGDLVFEPPRTSIS